MKFKLNDWMTMVKRLQTAHTLVAQAREARRAVADEEEAQGFLDDAVLYAWRFGEYAINVLLELAGLKQERQHKHAERIDELHGKGWLVGDYKKRIENLNTYRLKADYAGYSSVPSVHYSPADVENCLSAMDALRDEVTALLQREGKLPPP